MITELQWCHGWDWVLINSSGGKDSQTMLRSVVGTFTWAGVPLSRLVVVHADLGEVEWPGTKELAARQADHYGLRFISTKANGGDLLDYIEERGMWPSDKQRYCTSDYKRGPIRRVMTSLAEEYRDTRPRFVSMEAAAERRPSPCRILNCMGMRAQESPARAKKNPLKLCESASNGRREVWDWLPIHHWKMDEVWASIRESGVAHHYAYDLGMPRLSCCFCIFSPPSALRLAGQHNPALLNRYVEAEKRMGHKFRVDCSLESIQESIRPGELVQVEDWRM